MPFDLLGGRDLAELPDAAAVVFMVGAKFGTVAAPHLAWLVNAVLPHTVARIAGNVYPMVPGCSVGARQRFRPMPRGGQTIDRTTSI